MLAEAKNVHVLGEKLGVPRRICAHKPTGDAAQHGRPALGESVLSMAVAASLVELNAKCTSSYSLQIPTHNNREQNHFIRKGGGQIDAKKLMADRASISPVLNL